MRPSIPLQAALLLFCTAQALAATFVVDTTSNLPLAACTAAPADCSLRSALFAATGNDTIQFNIPTSEPGCVPATGVCTLLPPNAWPEISTSGSVLLDGTTQPGWQPNTNTPDQGGSNAQLKIVLSGTACGGASGCEGILYFVGNGTVRGLVINGFRTNSGGGTALSFSRSTFAAIEGCFIGTDVTGTIAVPNGIGIVFSGNPFGGGATSSGRIGGTSPAQRNVISGNSSTGIQLSGTGHLVLGNLIGTNALGNAALGNGIGVATSSGAGFSQFVGNAAADGRNVISGNALRGISVGGASGTGTNGHRIVGNFIGTDVTGTLPLGNGVVGVQLDAVPAAGEQPALVGGTLAGEGNVIAFNGTQGVATRVTRGEVLGNRIYRNGQLGISSLTGDNGSASGRKVNDPGDVDGGANEGQNHPQISAFAIAGGNVDLSYRVDSATGNSAYPLRVEFFRADGDEGRDFLGADEYTAAQAQTVKPVSVPIPAGVTLTANDVVVATATDAAGNTSEFSFSPASLAIQTPVASPCTSTDSVFCNGFEPGAQQSLVVRVGATAASGPFSPNGVVSVTDNRGGSCNLTLLPVATPPLSSEGSCILVNSGAAGPIAITATLNTFRSAFGSPAGGNVVAIGNFIVE